jgi:hypothetical protein
VRRGWVGHGGRTMVSRTLGLFCIACIVLLACVAEDAHAHGVKDSRRTGKYRRICIAWYGSTRVPSGPCISGTTLLRSVHYVQSFVCIKMFCNSAFVLATFSRRRCPRGREAGAPASRGHRESFFAAPTVNPPGGKTPPATV